MKTYCIYYTDTFQHSPSTNLVHKSYNKEARVYPMPKPVPGKGFANLKIEFAGFLWRFSSLEELHETIRFLSPKNMVSPVQSPEIAWPSEHWSGKLPAKVKAWKYREKAVKYFKEVQAHFEEETGIQLNEPIPWEKRRYVMRTGYEGEIEYKVVVEVMPGNERHETGGQ
jgi:hypothetical protein